MPLSSCWIRLQRDHSVGFPIYRSFILEVTILLSKLQSVLPKMLCSLLGSLFSPCMLCFRLIQTQCFILLDSIFHRLTKISIHFFAGEGSDDDAFSKISYIYSENPHISWSCSCWGGHNFGHLSYDQEIVPPTSGASLQKWLEVGNCL